jgi:nickel/cobalt transporter (NicO) family protein
MEFLIGLQRWINASIAADLSAFAATRDWAALAAVLPLGILFGAVHALTPGHGKTVLASYLVGSRLAVLRGIGVAGALALTHVGSAVVLALAAAPILSRTLGGVGRAPILEDLSRGVLALIGLWFVYRAWRGPSHEHREGLMVGVIAGLVPCPLTLFAMFLALSRGVPEAGLTFAVAMMLGVGLTLGVVAVLTVIAREWVVTLIARHGGSVEKASRILERSPAPRSWLSVFGNSSAEGCHESSRNRRSMIDSRGRTRVKIWRRLQGLGAISIKSSVYALPAVQAAQEDFEWLLREFRRAAARQCYARPASSVA